MNKEEVFRDIRLNTEKKFRFLKDKPEETVDTTLKALWNMAAGIQVSAEKAATLPLPELSEEQVIRLSELIAIRLKGLPLAYITGRQNFMEMELMADKRALIPRKETEILGKKALEISLEMAKARDELVIIDACCGSGNLGLALARYNPKCTVFASDLSPEAVDLTRENIAFSGLEDRVSVSQGDLLAAYDTSRFIGNTDMVVCNPPYISSAKVTRMEAEISEHEPALAFDGGMLGTGIIQKLIRHSAALLHENGCLIFEVGEGQGSFFLQLCERSQLYTHIEPFYDDSGNIRVISVLRK